MIEQAQAQKAAALRPYTPGAAEMYLDYAEDYLTNGRLTWHPFFHSAYSGGGFTLGAGYLKRVGPYDTLDLRGSVFDADYSDVPMRAAEQIEKKYKLDRLEDIPKLIGDLRKRMHQHADLMEFEKAAELRDQIKELEELELEVR